MAIVVPFTVAKMAEAASKARKTAVAVSMVLKGFFSFLSDIFLSFFCFLLPRSLLVVMF